MNQVTHHDFELFETEAIEVDFISFNIKRVNFQQMAQLASYLKNLGFNSYQKQLDTKQSRYYVSEYER